MHIIPNCTFKRKILPKNEAFMGEKVLSKLFIKFKTPVPSSAAVERFFSQGKDILKAKRASLANETFEMFIFERQQTSLEEHGR